MRKSNSSPRQSSLTKRQFQVFSCIRSFLQTEGYCPSFEEIGRSLGLSSVATVHKHICSLEAKGLIRRYRNQSRSIEILHEIQFSPHGNLTNDRMAEFKFSDSLPLLGRIAAGQPLEAVPLEESLSLKEFVASENCFVLQVKGDSMIEDQIRDGDLVVVEKTATAKNGDTVVALLENNEATLKKYFQDKDGTIRLQPANASMRPVFVLRKDLKIQGRVIAVLRKY